MNCLGALVRPSRRGDRAGAVTPAVRRLAGGLSHLGGLAAEVLDQRRRVEVEAAQQLGVALGVDLLGQLLLGPGGRLRVAAEADLLHDHLPGDVHLGSPSSSSRKPTTRWLTSLAASMCGEWPAPASTSTRPWARAASAWAAGSTRSCSPQTTSSGTGSRSSSPASTLACRPDGYMAAVTVRSAASTPSRR